MLLVNVEAAANVRWEVEEKEGEYGDFVKEK